MGRFLSQTLNEWLSTEIACTFDPNQPPYEKIAYIPATVGEGDRFPINEQHDQVRLQPRPGLACRSALRQPST